MSEDGQEPNKEDLDVYQVRIFQLQERILRVSVEEGRPIEDCGARTL